MECVTPAQVFAGREALLPDHFVFSTLESAGVLRCTQHIGSSGQGWLIAQVSSQGSNMSGQLFAGLTAVLFDMDCGMLFSSTNGKGATAYLNTTFAAPVILPRSVVVQAEIDMHRSEGRKVFITARMIECAAGTIEEPFKICATADSLFVASRDQAHRS